MGRFNIFMSSVLISLFVGQAAAHKPLPSVNWCSGVGVTVKIVGEFQFSRAVLESYKTCLLNGTCVLRIGAEARLGTTDEASHLEPTAKNEHSGLPGCRSVKDCGESNDDWMVGTRVASSFCSSYQKPRISPTSDIGSVILHVTAPDSYNVGTHHTSYSVTSGLAGQCLRCEARN
jgi:hypothetical protein